MPVPASSSPPVLSDRGAGYETLLHQSREEGEGEGEGEEEEEQTVMPVCGVQFILHCSPPSDTAAILWEEEEEEEEGVTNTPPLPLPDPQAPPAPLMLAPLTVPAPATSSSPSYVPAGSNPC